MSITPMTAATLIHGDAFDFLSEIEPDSIDLIISSPPYFMGKEYDTSSDINDFISVLQRLRPLLIRALKPGGHLCWQVGNHVSRSGLIPLDALTYTAFLDDSLQLRNRIIWTFGHGNHAKLRFSGRHETIMWYSKGDSYYFDLDSVRVPQKYPGKRHYKGPKKGQYSGNPLGKNPGDVWEIPNVNARHVEKTDHPCQFPVALVQRLTRALSRKGDLICDPFAGAASTGVGALIEGRRFLGCEIDRKYWSIGCERLSSVETGSVRIRSVDTPRYVPNPRTAVATRPKHFKIKVSNDDNR